MVIDQIVKATCQRGRTGVPIQGKSTTYLIVM